MARRREFHFRIDAYTPDTIPMARLSEYMADLAAMLGSEHAVHFARVDESSTDVVHWIEEGAVSEVTERVASIEKRKGPYEGMRAYRSLNKKLADDNSRATWGDAANNILEFPGVGEPQTVSFGAFNQDGTIEGELIRVGGAGDLATVHIQQEKKGAAVICQARREVAQELGHHLYKYIRVSGNGRWHRDENGDWVLNRFTIGSFESLVNETLTTVVERLRGVPGSEWDQIEDPLRELKRIREGPEDIQ